MDVMSVLIIVIHIIVCVALILIVLLQTGKGSDMGAAFGGGGSQTLFGSTGASTFLSKATTVAAVIFMITCFTLAYISSNRNVSSIVLDSDAAVEEKAPAAEATSESAAQPATEAPANPEAAPAETE